MPVKKSSLGLQNLVKSAHKTIERLQIMSIKLINAVTGGNNLLTANHIGAVREERREGQESCNEANKINSVETLQDFPKLNLIILLCKKNTSSLLTTHGTTVIGIVLSAMKFRYFLCACYNLTPFPQPTEKIGQLFPVLIHTSYT